MNRVFLTCRSQTEALLMSRLLERSGVKGVLTRPPREDQSSSCAYAVRIREDELSTAEQALRQGYHAPYRVRTTPM